MLFMYKLQNVDQLIATVLSMTEIQETLHHGAYIMTRFKVSYIHNQFGLCHYLEHSNIFPIYKHFL